MRKLKAWISELWGGDRLSQLVAERKREIAELQLRLARLRRAHEADDYRTADALSVYEQLLKTVEAARQIESNEVRRVVISPAAHAEFTRAREKLGEEGPDWTRVGGVPIVCGPPDQRRLWVIELHHFMDH
jgi:hypothetical protein